MRLVINGETTEVKDTVTVGQLLTTLNRDMGKTIILVTHDPKAAHYARRTLHLEKGELSNDNGAQP